MAGYCGFSKSNNAIAAENEGRFPASKLAKALGVCTDAIRECMTSDEYHHTSSRYNSTDFYDGRNLLIIAGKSKDELDTWPAHQAMSCDDDEADEKAATDLLAQIREADARIKAERRNPQTGEGVVEWIEWFGSAKHPTASANKARAAFTKKGKTFTITLLEDSADRKAGYTFRKRENTRGFFIVLSSKEKEKEQR